MRHSTGLLLLPLLLALAAPVRAQQHLTPELLWSFARVSDPQLSPDGRLVVYGVQRIDIAANRGSTDLYIVPAAGGEPRRLTTMEGSEFNARWRPDGRVIGFIATQGGSAQLWEIAPDGTGLRQVSNIEGGIANFLYAPTGTHVSFTREVRIDSTTADRFPDLPKADARIIDGLMFRHWDTWEDGEYSHVFIAPYQDGRLGEPIDLMPGEGWDAPLRPFGGVEQIAWSPDARFLAYTSKKLRGTEAATSTDSDIYLYELASGRTTNLSEGLDGYDQDPAFSPDGRWLVWASMERPGYEADRRRLMLHDLTTGERREITAGFDQNADGFAWAPDGRTLFFTSSIHGTVQLYAWDREPRRGRAAIRRITDGLHSYGAFSVAGPARRPVIVAARQSMSMPTELFRVDPASGEAVQLTATNAELLERIRMGRVERRWIRATDGDSILTWVIYPPDFDASKRYPALLYAQGGPQSMVGQSFSYRWNFQLMAANGYIVVAPNRRGTPGFGQAWTDAIARDWGGQAMRDLRSAIDAVAQEPFVDEDRIGAVGASFGGYSIFWLAGHNQDRRFKAFIAHDGVFNLESMYGATEEIFFPAHDLGGPYWATPRPASYDAFSPHRFVANWNAPILIIQGGRDYRVPETEAFQAFTAAQLQGVPSRLLYFPEENHWVLRPQNGILWQRVFFDWLDRYLKPSAS